MPHQLCRTPDGGIAVFSHASDDFVCWRRGKSEVRRRFFTTYSGDDFDQLWKQALADQPLRGDTRGAHPELLGRFEVAVSTIGLVHDLTALEDRLAAMGLVDWEIPPSIRVEVERANGPVASRLRVRSGLAPLHDPIDTPPPPSEEPSIVITPDHLQCVANTAAAWWADRLMSGDRALFETFVAERVMSDLQTSGFSRMKVDHDPEGLLLDAVRHAGVSCRGYMFSADGVLPSKSFLRALPEKIEGREGYHWFEILPSGELGTMNPQN